MERFRSEALCLRKVVAKAQEARLVYASLVLTAILFSPPKILRAEPSNPQGYVTSSLCPYDCKTKGIKRKFCRDWKEGGRCFVEDLSRQTVKVEPISPIGAPQLPKIQMLRDSTSHQDSGVFANFVSAKKSLEQKEVEAACKGKAPFELPQPSIQIRQARQLGALADNLYQLEGSLEGTCLINGGYFESGTLKKKLSLETKKSFGSFRFECVVNPTRKPEIRLYNTAGERASLPIEVNNYLGAPLRSK